MAFDTLPARFAVAAQSHDAPGAAARFVPDGCRDDPLFGRHDGRTAIAAMLDRFHVAGAPTV